MAKFLKEAIKRPGALRGKLEKKKLIKKGDKVTVTAAKTLRATAKKKGDTRTVRQANLFINVLSKVKRKR